VLNIYTGYEISADSIKVFANVLNNQHLMLNNLIRLKYFYKNIIKEDKG